MTGAARPMPFGAHRPGRLDAYGTTVFAEVTALATATGSVNLGQGFPDSPGPIEVLSQAVASIEAGDNQYAPGRGVPDLLSAIAGHAERFYGQKLDPAGEILVTAGATEAIAASVMALCGPGDEVVVFEPYYDSYGAVIDLSGATKRNVQLRHPEWGFDPDELRRAVGPATRAILLNTPHNPTGRVFTHGELELVAELCREHDLIAITDEVYEHLVFSDSHGHERLATFPGMAERTVTISSAGKTFSVTGWKIGWAIATPGLIESIKAVKQFLTYTSGTPLQHAVASGLRLPPERLTELRKPLERCRDQLCDGLDALGWDVTRPQATYFVIADIRSLQSKAGSGDAGDAGGRSAGSPSGLQFCRDLIAGAGVAAIPVEVFYDPDDRGAAEHLIRFAFCKRPEVIAEALERLARWQGGSERTHEAFRPASWRPPRS